MEIHVEHEGRRAVAKLLGEMTIYHAVEAKTAILQSLEGADSIQLDLSGVTDLDTAGMQILILARRTAESAGKQLSLVDHSAPVRDVFELYNASTLLPDPIVIPAARSKGGRGSRQKAEQS